MLPAARLTDPHVCPFAGGPISAPGVPTVFIGGLPAAVMGDVCTCAMGADVIIRASTTVFTGGRGQARMGDQVTSGGTIAFGWPTVLVGG